MYAKLMQLFFSNYLLFHLHVRSYPLQWLKLHDVFVVHYYVNLNLVRPHKVNC